MPRIGSVASRTGTHPPPAPVVRLHSCDPARAGRSWHFRGFRRTIQAWRLEAVLPALREVEAEVAECGYAVGLVAYEAASAFEPALTTHPPVPGLPLLWFAVFDEREEADVPGGRGGFELEPWEPSVSEAEHAAAIARIREWIAAGDTYQVNHTLRLHAAFAGDPMALYHRLCRAQRAAYCAYLDLGQHAVLSASPELFFRWSAGTLELRPMKGTRRRGRWAAEDRALAGELLTSDKERAENLMIVDLLRNDAGRVSRFGSVHVPRLFEVEQYPTVHQLTSTVRSLTRPGTTLTDVFRALFPSGSVTGAPKVRTMQIIHELEPTPRGVYTGAIGMVSRDEAVFNVAIRTLVLDRAAGIAELGVGGGITYDSEAGAEFRECLAKAAFVRHEPRTFSLLETLLWEPDGGYLLLDEHLARLANSAAYFHFPCDPATVRARLAAAAEGVAEPTRVRLLLDGAGAMRVEVQPLPPSPEPVRVALSATPVHSGEPLLFHKTTERAVYETRRAERPDCDDVLLVNERGELTESTIANLVVRLRGTLWTPPLESGVLPGVFREMLLREGTVHERVLRPVDLGGADAVYLINSVRKWRLATVVP